MAARNYYALSTDEKMRETTKKVIGGNPNYLSYWKKVKILDRTYDKFSAESLRAHWLLMMKKDRNRGFNDESLLVRNYDDADLYICTTPQPALEMRKSDGGFGNDRNLANTEKQVQRGLGTEIKFGAKYLTPTVVARNKRESDRKIIPLEKIDNVFDDLVDICSILAKRRLLEKEVIQVLIEKKGKLNEVVNYYNRR